VEKSAKTSAGEAKKKQTTNSKNEVWKRVYGEKKATGIQTPTKEIGNLSQKGNLSG